MFGLVVWLLAPAAAHPGDAEPGVPDSGQPEWGTVATPLRMVNLNPFHLLYGLPASAGVPVLGPDSWELIASMDMASYLNGYTSDAESAVLVGETYRVAFAWRQGFTERLEYLLEVSAVGHRRGVFDEFIEDWHDLFGLPQGQRDKVPDGRLALWYADGAGVRIDVQKNLFALGDVTLGLGYSVPDLPLRNDGLTIRASLKLPTGDEYALTGSGGLAGSVWAETSGALPVAAASRRWLYAATAGVLAAERPRLLSDIGGRFIFFSRLGVTWRPLDQLNLTAQLDIHSSPYRASRLPSLADPMVMIAFGGAWRLTRNTTLEVAVAEDDGGRRSAPDIGLHLALRITP